ncbi:MAG TPA: acyl carrier protein [Kofleriaceae bacterium]|nr:acyl carrier protein [Kofleriaceae bacterium]
MNDIKQTVKAYIVDTMLMGADGSDIADDTSFLERSLLDSTGVLELVSFLQDTYKIEIEDQELTPENLDSLDRIAAFVTAKQGAR